jgi:hypothetical protein
VFEYFVDKPVIRVMGVPPEEMRLDRYARSFATSRIVGHERVVPVDELTAMGYEREQCLDYLQSQDIQNFTMESQLRTGLHVDQIGDGVAAYGEWYQGRSRRRWRAELPSAPWADHAIITTSANRVKF